MNLNIDPRKQDQNLRGTVMLPHGTGKTVRVGVFARGDRAKEAEAAGADVVGAEDLVEKVQAGQIDFDRAIATPDMMALVGRLGKILGPRGLMPNPRLGTVTQNVTEAVQAAKGGQVEFRAEKAGIVHAGVGKASFTDDALVDNVRAFVGAITRGKPSGVKGTYIKRVALSSTMGPAVKVEIGGPCRGDANVTRTRLGAGGAGASWRRSGGPSPEAAADRQPASGPCRHGVRRRDASDRAVGCRGHAAAAADAQRRGALSRDQEPADATRARRHGVRGRWRRCSPGRPRSPFRRIRWRRPRRRSPTPTATTS